MVIKNALSYLQIFIYIWENSAHARHYNIAHVLISNSLQLKITEPAPDCAVFEKYT